MGGNFIIYNSWLNRGADVSTITWWWAMNSSITTSPLDLKCKNLSRWSVKSKLWRTHCRSSQNSNWYNLFFFCPLVKLLVIAWARYSFHTSSNTIRCMILLSTMVILTEFSTTIWVPITRPRPLSEEWPRHNYSHILNHKIEQSFY